ncbi:hypothetical protein [Gandjariella thermophila]|uniref:hypothetical protein n=1 Tax=Gandjariella thermophila TaxID=1931992 RepID=UPI001CEF97B0|nr:hypothetical protein [Gandjariella thermophila]
MSLSPAAVVEPIVTVIDALPGGSLVAGSFRQAFLALPPIPIGAIPSGQGYISGATIANQVVAQLGKTPLGALLTPVSNGVRQVLTSACGIAVTGVNAAAGQVQAGASAAASAVQQGTAALSPPSQSSGGPGSGQQSPPASPGAAQPGGSGFAAVGGYSPGGAPLYDFGGGLVGTGRASPFNYGDLPFAIPGDWAPSPGLLYGNEVPGYAPQLGTLGAAQDDVRTAAGGAQALNPVRDDNRVGAPVLLAVVMLSCVTAALVRRWVLTRAAAATG